MEEVVKMTEWGVVLVLITLGGGIISIVKPIVSLTGAITRLNESVEKLSKDLDSTIQTNTESHQHIWEHNHKQDKTLNELDKRVAILEERHAESC